MAVVCKRWHVTPQVNLLLLVVQFTADVKRTIYLKRNAEQMLHPISI